MIWLALCPSAFYEGPLGLALYGSATSRALRRTSLPADPTSPCRSNPALSSLQTQFPLSRSTASRGAHSSAHLRRGAHSFLAFMRSRKAERSRMRPTNYE